MTRSHSLYFNEIFNTDGQVRPHYVDVLNHWKSIPSNRRRALLARSKRLFSGDYAQDPLPRILTQHEFHFLNRGVEQRARAILAFLHDYCTKGTHWKRVIPPTTLAAMIERHHMTNTLQNLKPERLAFPYGPDIIRDQSGRWRIVEDSAGMIGGMGDLLQSHKILFRLVPKFKSVLNYKLSGFNDPQEFFHDLAKHFSRKAAENDGIPLLYLRSYKDEPDHETRRLAQTFAKFGIESITSSNRQKKIQIKEGKDAGVYLCTAGANQRVGALIFHTDPELLDCRILRMAMVMFHRSKNKMDRNRSVHSFIRGLTAPAIQTALVDEQAWSNFSPGVQFINDKIFGLHVDTMIRKFLRETPLIESIPARPLTVRSRSRGWHLDHAILGALRRDRGRYVVKLVDEDGGSGVWIGQKESKKSLNQLVEKLKISPEKYIIQEFEHLSVLGNQIVDLRIHAHVDSERIIVSNTPWGRASGIHGNGKVNIGSRGIYSPVFVVKTPPQCTE